MTKHNESGEPDYGENAPAWGHQGDCCLIGDQVIAYLSGTLSLEKRLEVESHLDICPDCFCDVQQQIQLEQMLEDQRFAMTIPLAAISDQIGSYEFVRFLDSGGQGQVWLVKHQALDHFRAAKLVPRSSLRPEDFVRLRDEMQIMGALGKHLHRVLLYDVLETSEYIALIMEFIDGGSLHEHIVQNGPMPWRDAVRVIRGVGEGLREVHHRCLLHRDIKPKNILLESVNGNAVLGDFGLIAYVQQAQEVVGTAGYVAPELLEARASDRSDVFSLCATLCCAVTGRPPFDASDLLASLRHARLGLAEMDPLWSALPPALRKVVRAGLAPRPEDRPDLAFFLAALQAAEIHDLAIELDHVHQLQVQREEKIPPCRISFHRRMGESNSWNRLSPIHACQWDGFQFLGCPADLPIISVNTGDLLALHIQLEEVGFISVLNVSSEGELEILYAQDHQTTEDSTTKQQLNLQMLVSPPSGMDRLLIVWTSTPMERTVEGWKQWLAEKQIELPKSAVLRKLELLNSFVENPPSALWWAHVVGLAHLDGVPNVEESVPVTQPFATRRFSLPPGTSADDTDQRWDSPTEIERRSGRNHGPNDFPTGPS